jgi:hypothetical protein
VCPQLQPLPLLNHLWTTQQRCLTSYLLGILPATHIKHQLLTTEHQTFALHNRNRFKTDMVQWSNSSTRVHTLLVPYRLRKITMHSSCPLSIPPVFLRRRTSHPLMIYSWELLQGRTSTNSLQLPLPKTLFSLWESLQMISTRYRVCLRRRYWSFWSHRTTIGMDHLSPCRRNLKLQGTRRWMQVRLEALRKKRCILCISNSLTIKLSMVHKMLKMGMTSKRLHWRRKSIWMS